MTNKKNIDNKQELNLDDLDQVSGGALTARSIGGVRGGAQASAVRIKGFADSVKKSKVNGEDGEYNTLASR